MEESDEVQEFKDGFQALHIDLSVPPLQRIARHPLVEGNRINSVVHNANTQFPAN